MRALLLLNPNATTTSGAVRDALVGLLGSELDLTVAATKSRGHAVHLAAGAVHEGLDAVFALGGDGTANEVLQGLAGSDVPLGLLPGGGANVLARGLGLPNDAAEAARLQLESLHAGLDRRIGLGTANGRWFGFQAGVGYDASVVRSVEQHPRTKRVLRQGGFVLLAVREWFAGLDRRDPAARLLLPGEERPGPPATMLVVANHDPYTFLGPLALHVTPGAHVDRGLATCEIGPLPTGELLRTILRAFRTGDHDQHPQVRLHEDLASLEVVAHRPVPVMVDGDHFGEHTRMTFTSVPSALRVLVDVPPPDGLHRH